MSSRELADLRLHIRGLVLVREILRQRGASAAELDEHTAELDRLKGRLAKLSAMGCSRSDASTGRSWGRPVPSL